MSKILITGGAGMIGSNLVKRLVDKGEDVYIVDNLWRGNLEYLKDSFGKYIINLKTNFYNRDLSKVGIIDDIINNFDYIFHLADIVAGIEYIFNNQGYVFRENFLINSNIISSVRKSNKIKGFIYVGTACSFPSTKQNSINNIIPLIEEDLYPASPESAYGWSKLMGQYETELLENETKILTSVLMFHNVYGTPCDFGNRSQVIPSIIKKAINYPNEDFIVWGSGNQSRSFIHVDDAVNALILTLEKGLGKGTIQIGTSENISIKELSNLVVNISGKNIEIIYDINKPEGDKARCADFSRAKSILGWNPTIKLIDGLENQYKWIESKIHLY